MSDAPAKPSEADFLKMMHAFGPRIIANSAYTKHLGLWVEDQKEGEVWIRIPFRAELAASSKGGLHNGVVTALLDSCGGACISTRLQEARSIATVDLRLDFLRPCEAGKDVTGHGVCYWVEDSLAHIRATAYHDNVDHPVATATGTFALTSMTNWGSLSDRYVEATAHDNA